MTRRTKPPAATPVPEPDPLTVLPEPTIDDRAGREPGELVAGLSPVQIIGGFAVLASLVVLLRRRARRKG